MEFKFRGFYTQRQYTHLFPTSSSSSSLNYTYFSDQAINDGLWSGRSVLPVDMRDAIQRDIEKERIREEIIAEDKARRRILEAEVRRELIMEIETPAMQSGGGFPSSLMLGQPLCENRRIAMPFQERYDGNGRHRRDFGGFEVVPFQRRPLSPKIKEITTYPSKDFKKEIVGLGKPTGATMSCSKRKAPSSSSLAVAGSSGFCSNYSKKIKEEWSCAVCEITATCERGLNEHLAGKKHLAKLESFPGNNTGAEIGLGIIKNSVKKQISEIKSFSIDSKEVKMNEGGRMKKKFKFWCKICQTGAHNEKIMSEHKKGKKHMKNRRKKARAKMQLSDRKSI